MSRTKALLRHGRWPDVPAAPKQPVELTAAALAQGMRALEELNRLGVSVRLEDGKARFRSSRVVMPCEARRLIERQGDLIEACLQREQERSVS